MSAFRVLLAIHIVAGSLSLLLLWIPLFARKGGKLHRRVGWGYVVAMGTVAVTALGLCVFRLTNADSRDDMAGLFLGHVAILTGKNVFAGVRALQHRRANGPRGLQGGERVNLGWDVAVSVALVASSTGMTWLGLSPVRTLRLVFAGLGFASAGPELVYLLKRPTQPNEWFFRHLVNMLTSGIAAITAFLVVNAGRFGVGRFHPVVWILPGAIGAVGIAIWSAYYRRQFAARAAAKAQMQGATIAIAGR